MWHTKYDVIHHLRKNRFCHLFQKGITHFVAANFAFRQPLSQLTVVAVAAPLPTKILCLFAGALVFLDSSHTYRETVGITHYTKPLRVWCRSPLQGACVRRKNNGFSVARRTKIEMFLMWFL